MKDFPEEVRLLLCYFHHHDRGGETMSTSRDMNDDVGDEYLSFCYFHGPYFNPESDGCPRCLEEEREEEEIS